MARFALLLPREEMVEPAGRIARELEMDVVLNQSVPTERILDLMGGLVGSTGADILWPEAARRPFSRSTPTSRWWRSSSPAWRSPGCSTGPRLVSHLERPKIGVVTIPNMVGNIQGFEEIFDIELHTYFISGLSEMERGAEQAVADGMDVILGGDFVNAYCRRLGKRTLFFDGTEDSLRTSLLHARNVGQVADAERRNTAHLQVLLDYSFNGILELDARGIIVQSNDVACKILEQEREKLVGLPLSTLMPREDAEFWPTRWPSGGSSTSPCSTWRGCTWWPMPPPWRTGTPGRAWYFPSMRCRRWSARESGLCGSATGFSAIWLTAGLKT